MASATINLQPALNQLALSEIDGGAATSFTTRRAGSATVVISPDELTMNVSIADAMGRSVMNAVMTGPAQAPAEQNKLLSWTCTAYDQVAALGAYPTGGSFFGDVETTKQIVMDKDMVEAGNVDAEITTSYTDGFGWSVGSLDQDNNLSRTKYDVAGNPLEILDRSENPADPRKTSYAYDNLGRQTSVTNPANETVSTTFWPETGRIHERTDAKMNTITFDEEDYDVLGRLTNTVDRLGHVTIREYEKQNLKWIEDAEGHRTVYAYDLLGRKTLSTYADDREEKTTYDAAGRVFTVEQLGPTEAPGEGILHQYHYAFSGVVDWIKFYNNRDTGQELQGQHTFEYDDWLRRIKATNTIDDVEHTFGFTDRGQLEFEELDYDTNNANNPKLKTTFDYDSRGRQKSIEYPSGNKAFYTYTTRSELDTVSWPDTSTEIEDPNYDEAGRLIGTDRPQVDETRLYDDAQPNPVDCQFTECRDHRLHVR